MFKLAKPIFLKDLQKEMNITAFFAANFDCSGENAKLLITGASSYRITVNGEFVGYGPARAPHGFTRIDEIDISKHISWGLNQIVVELASYNCAHFNYVNNPGFLQAEIIADNKIVAATGHNFAGFADVERVQKVMRMSFQRPFSEVYVRNGGSMVKIPVETVETNLNYMIRKTEFPDYDIVNPVNYAYKGNLTVKKLKEYPYQRFIDKMNANPTMGSNGFYKKDIKHKPIYDILDRPRTVTEKDLKLEFPIALKKGEYAVLDMGKNVTGFIRHNVLVRGKKARMIIGFNERDTNGEFLPFENSITNVVDYQMIDGEFEGETFEVYGFRYLYIFALDGDIVLKDVSVREYVYPVKEYPEIKTDNKDLQAVYDAAVETYRQNTLDVFMDCPTRERAGWNMDSFFTARTEYFLTGKTTVNESMMNNIVVAREFPGIPKGMMPMCYPAETMGQFIPQWAMWYGLQVYEHIERTGQKTDKYRKVLYALYDWFKEFENEDGLLQNLEGWNFVEWSKCNDEDWIQDVNYPTNMLYSLFLSRMSEMFEDPELKDKSDKIKEKVVEKSFNGKYFEENARFDENGVLKNTDHVSETCQYYAIWTGVADINDEKYVYLKNAVLKSFGAFGDRDFVPYEPSNAIIGYYLRMDVLLKLNEKELLLKEITDFFGQMVEKTGTLWEHKTESNSMNHGFASWVAEVIYKCLED